MNSEAYIGLYQNGTIRLFPNNIGSSIVTKICRRIPTYGDKLFPECLFIQRQENMVYYIYAKKIPNEDNMYVCGVIGINNVLIYDIPKLYKYFKEKIYDLINNYRLKKYFIPNHEKNLEDLQKAVNILRSNFNLQFNKSGKSIGAHNYSSHPGINRLHIDAQRKLIKKGTNGNDKYSVIKSIENGDLQIIINESVLLQLETKLKDHTNDTTKKQSIKQSNKKLILTLICIAVIFGSLLYYCAYHPLNREVQSNDSDNAIITETSSESIEKKIIASEGMRKNGHLIHYFEGYFSAKESKYPVKLAFIQTDNRISKAIYKSVIYGGKLTMKFKFVKDEIILSAKDGNNDFVIRLHPDGANYIGEAIDGKSVMDVYLTSSNEPFKINNLD